MRILVTGSAGRLGRHVMPKLRASGHRPVGLDVRRSRTTHVVASVEDRAAIRRAMDQGRFDAVIHLAALHRPHLATQSARFRSVNVAGTRHLLECASAAGVTKFVFASTTAVMTDRLLAEGVFREARWLNEDSVLGQPCDLYGTTKLEAEGLCRDMCAEHGMGLVILRFSRFFHRDLLDHSRDYTQANHRANEMLHRRVDVRDAAAALVRSVELAGTLPHDLFIVSAPTPFATGDCKQLYDDARGVVENYFPEFPALYDRRGWTMYPSIDRVYDSRRAQSVLGIRFSQSFANVLDQIEGTNV